MRHESVENGSYRVVLLGRLEAADAVGLSALADELGAILPVGTTSVRMILSKVWSDGQPPGEAVAALVGLGRRLIARGVAPCWVDCPPDISAVLIASGVTSGDAGDLVGASADDERAGAGWSGVPLRPAPTRVG